MTSTEINGRLLDRRSRKLIWRREQKRKKREGWCCNLPSQRFSNPNNSWQKTRDRKEEEGRQKTRSGRKQDRISKASERGQQTSAKGQTKVVSRGSSFLSMTTHVCLSGPAISDRLRKEQAPLAFLLSKRKSEERRACRALLPCTVAGRFGCFSLDFLSQRGKTIRELLSLLCPSALSLSLLRTHYVILPLLYLLME